MPTIKEIEAEMAQQVLLERLRENDELARSALRMCAVLVRKLGGEVEVTMQDVDEIIAYDLAQITATDRGSVILRIERRRPN